MLEVWYKILWEEIPDWYGQCCKLHCIKSSISVRDISKVDKYLPVLSPTVDILKLGDTPV